MKFYPRLLSVRFALLILLAAGSLPIRAAVEPLDRSTTPPAAAPADEVYLYSFFREPNGFSGIRLAWSEDFFHWTEIPGDVFLPSVGVMNDHEPYTDRHIMRDSFVDRGPDGVFHAVWTCAWRDVNTIGYARSTDLVHWTDEKLIPVMATQPDVNNCWAPKLFYDEGEQQWLIFWSSMLRNDMFPPSPVPGTTSANRIWYVTTKDFETISEAKVFFDPGYPCIDAMMMKDGDTYRLVFKDSRANKARGGPVQPEYQNIRMATATSPYGPFGDITAPITGYGTGKWCNEGPTAIRVGEWFYCFYDHHAPPLYYGATRSRDLATWEDASEMFDFPPKTKHGHIFRMPKTQLHALLEKEGQ
jgi:hypothetical protein